MKKSLWIGLLRVFLQVFIIPLAFFAVVEIFFRVSGVNTDAVKSKSLDLAIPLWVANDLNFSAAESVYKEIVVNSLPPESAEWMNLFEAARYVRYKMKPRVSASVSNSVNLLELEKKRKVLIQSNREGFRTKDIPHEKKKNVYRIVLLGDSGAFGWGVNQEERFGQYLEDRLNSVQKAITYEVINLGIPGYTSSHGVAVFDHYALKYHPDMVILSFGANDGRPIPKRAKKMLQKKSWFDDVHYFLLHFKTYRFIQKIFLSRSDRLQRMRKTMRKKEPLEAYVTPEEFQRNLEYIFQKGRERGIQTVFLGLCCPLEYLQVMGKVAQRMNIVHIDGMFVLLQSIRAVEEGKMYPELARYYRDFYGEDTLEERRLLYVTNDTCHPNIIGNKIIADALYERVFKELLK